MKLDKTNINIIKLLCGLIPKTAPNSMSTMIFITNINNKYVIYGGNIGIVKFIYYTNIESIHNLHIGTVGYILAAALKNTKQDIEILFDNHHIQWRENNDITSLKLMAITDKIQQIIYENPIMINMNAFIDSVKSIAIKIDVTTTKCYIHITNEYICFIIMDAGRLSVSNMIYCKTTYNLFATCNYEALNSIIPLLTDDIMLYIFNNILIIKQNDLELQLGINKVNYINYTKYINTQSNYIVINTNLLHNALKSLAYINKSQSEIITFCAENNNLLLECYNPNIGSRKVTLNIIEGSLIRNLKYNLAWLTDAIKTVLSENCMLIYGNISTHPLIVKNNNIHVIAPIISY